jgi:hypothetical protein
VKLTREIKSLTRRLSDWRTLELALEQELTPEINLLTQRLTPWRLSVRGRTKIDTGDQFIDAAFQRLAHFSSCTSKN